VSESNSFYYKEFVEKTTRIF